MGKHQSRRAITTLECLLGVALVGTVIIGAYPRLSDAEILARNAQTRVNLGTLAEGLEAYHVDWAQFPYDGYSYNGSGGHDYNYWYIPIEMTTPVAYITAADMEDPHRIDADPYPHWQSSQLRYTCIASTWGPLYDDLTTTGSTSVYYEAASAEWGDWRLLGTGWDQTYGPQMPGWTGVSTYPACPIPYDPTNGLRSRGDILRSSLSEVGYLNIPQP